MPQKIYMFISKGNPMSVVQHPMLNTASVAGAPHMSASKSTTSLRAPILDRVHNAHAGCSSCGRH